MNAFQGLRYHEAKKREIFAAASAAGITVAFGAPIGGVLFALEAMAYYPSYRTMWHGFVCAMVASVTLESINPFRTGQIVLFQVVYDRNWHKFELIPFALLGVVGGLLGSAIIQVNKYFARLRKTNSFIANHQLLEVVIIALLTGIISYPDIYLRLQFSELLSHLFQECTPSSVGGLCNVHHWFYTFVLLIFAGIVGVILSSYTFGMNIPAGILMPSVVIGALIGRAVGSAMQAWQENHPAFGLFSSCAPEGVCITPGVYALVGAASMLTGVTRLTVSCVVIMFELTGALNYVLPIMAGVMLSKWVADAFGRQGFYEGWIELQDYPLIPRTSHQVVPEISAADVMVPVESLITLHSRGHTINELSRIVEASDVLGFPVITGSASSSHDFTNGAKAVDLGRAAASKGIIGYITRQDVAHVLKTALPANGDDECLFIEPEANERGIDFSEYVELSQIMSVKTPLLVVARTMQTLGLSYCLFAENGELRGSMTIKDLWYCLKTFKTETFLASTDGEIDDLDGEHDSDARLLSNRSDI
jgi:chloride channel 3/4/5